MIVEQAKGILAERGQVDVDAAFVRMRGHARDNNRRLGDVASDLIEGRLDPDALDPARDRPFPPSAP